MGVKVRKTTLATLLIAITILSTINFACAQDTNSTATATPNPTPTPTATPTPEPTYDIGIQALINDEKIKQASIIIDDQSETTGFVGQADFKTTAGMHTLQIYINNTCVYDHSLIITKDQIFKIDLTDTIEPLGNNQTAPTPTPIGNVQGEVGIYGTTFILMIALGGVVVVIIIVKRRD